MELMSIRNATFGLVRPGSLKRRRRSDTVRSVMVLSVTSASTDLTPEGTLVIPDPLVDDVVRFRRSSTADFASYQEWDVAIDDLDPATMLEPNAASEWALGDWWLKCFLVRNGVIVRTSNTETFELTE